MGKYLKSLAISGSVVGTVWLVELFVLWLSYEVVLRSLVPGLPALDPNSRVLTVDGMVIVTMILLSGFDI